VKTGSVVVFVSKVFGCGRVLARRITRCLSTRFSKDDHVSNDSSVPVERKFDGEGGNRRVIVLPWDWFDFVLNLNAGVRGRPQELDRAAPEQGVYKLVGPILAKQDVDEAKTDVQRRIDFIRGELCVGSPCFFVVSLRPIQYVAFAYAENVWKRRSRTASCNKRRFARKLWRCELHWRHLRPRNLHVFITPVAPFVCFACL
jgi:hypothetical protein